MTTGKADAWAKTQCMFARRVTDNAIRIPENFRSDFDPTDVVCSVDVPTGPGRVEHQAAFARLKLAFERAWSDAGQVAEREPQGASA